MSKKDIPAFYPNDNIQFTFGDLYQVKSQLNKYELGNISRIVNVLGGQYTEILQEHEEITQEDSYSEFEKETKEEQSLTTSTTEAMETSANSHQDKESSFAISGQVKANFGMIKAQVDSSYDNKNESGSSKSNAQSYAKNVVESSRKSVRTRVLNTKRKNTQIRDLETKKIGLDNRGGDNFVGVYRHVSEVHKAELIKHQKHLFAKIYIPTPSEHYANHVSDVDATNEEKIEKDVLKFSKDKGTSEVDFTFSSLTEDDDWLENNWTKLAAEFGLEEPEPYPNMMVQTKIVTQEMPTGERRIEEAKTQNVTFPIPEGYYPTNFEITALPMSNKNHNVQLNLTFPGREKFHQDNFSGTTDFDLKFDKNSTFGPDKNFDVGVYYGTVLAFQLNCVVTYKPNSNTLKMWQLKFYNQILEAAEGKEPIEERLGLSRKVNVLANADAAKKLIKEELERQTIQYVLGTDLNGFDSYIRAEGIPEGCDYPEIDIEKTNKLQSLVSFLSTSFDFEKMSYRFLPTYLGKECNRSKLFDSSSTGEVRDFLQASWTEIILPITKGEESKLFYMLETGFIWSGSDEETPLPHKREYLALSEEIEEDKIIVGDTQIDPVPVDEWTFNLPTAFEILQEGPSINGTPSAVESTDGITSNPE